MSALSRLRALALPVIALLAVPLIAATTPAPTSIAAVPAAVVSSAHPYSSPVWYPLGAAARANCYKSNPGCSGYHGYWAMDLLSKDYGNSEPVYAMGAGILHVAASGLRCDGSQGRGNWVWIDHGAGVVSIYGHLGVIRVNSGSYVTPSTEIATVGNTGYSNCKVHPLFKYLYVAVRAGGISGPYAQVTHLWACVSGAQRMWPQQLSGRYTSWNNVPISPLVANNLSLPATTRSCVPNTPATPSAASGFQLSGTGSGALRASWTTPSSVSREVVELQEWHPSLNAYGYSVYRSVAPGSSTTFTGLLNGRTYRARVSLANGAGYSAATAWITKAPAAGPQTPPARYLTPLKNELKFGWYRSNNNGSTIRSYQVAIRHYSSRGWSAWTYTTMSASLIHYNWYRLAAHTRYEIAARAVSAVGPSGWLYRSATTLS